MKKIISILLISHIAFSQTANLDTNTILIGQQINFTISNNTDSNESWPVYNEFLVKGIEIIKASRIDTTDNIITQRFVITAWDSGSYYIPSISFSSNNETEGLLLTVNNIVLEENAKLYDIKKPMKAAIGWSDIWPWLLIISIITLFIYLLKKYVFNNKKKINIKTPKIIIPADVMALEQLSALEKAKIWQAGDIKKYYTLISEIIRRYTENRFKFIALELTTYEIINELKNKVDKKQLNNITVLLERADLAKFAKSKPDENENKESMQLAKNFVKETKKVNNE